MSIDAALIDSARILQTVRGPKVEQRSILRQTTTPWFPARLMLPRADVTPDTAGYRRGVLRPTLMWSGEDAERLGIDVHASDVVEVRTELPNGAGEWSVTSEPEAWRGNAGVIGYQVALERVVPA